ncbi:PadR family transcriptional regulator [Gallibacterium anatis]|uniref:Lineage-specific thermal regulator protein n=1 Tax=Gallibacterium anatis TaxID=750 RepID=A0A0A2Y7T3_9PAST|nr:PadR family transcriptional regulator [Gallibacterium anatis]KGQ34153.1 lineage-specific thermal regulator protein [Gallibacterium anatis]KGQ39182.1 lineage-specific thermal regulator protein [Gallibacterium anatis]KGQ58638.1 lineage-specific thermal regulator protein [Gallibacterium anatis DSM 16844 = F 149]KGQ62887.1 lineage-specific thermal regulator protein [Gallibacterium anatis 7990]KGQ68524.1 lineage-specific thermal regulator protein [Gallibacterium anatis]
MALSHTILSILAHQAATGYDISKKFSQTYGLIWQATHQQVYRELNLLEKQGLISFSLHFQQGKPDRKEYQLTDQGEQQLKKWLLESTLTNGILRDEFISRILAALKCHPQMAFSAVKKRQLDHQQNIENMQKLMQELELLDEKTLYDSLMILLLKRSIRQEDVNLQWLEQDLLPMLQLLQQK